MKHFSFAALLGLVCILDSSCSSYSPLHDRGTVPKSLRGEHGPGVRVTFLGNTTIHISDGDTNLLVDGFLSRPHVLKTFFGRIAPEPAVIEHELRRAGIHKVGAILLGHAHHDHALDAPAVAQMKNAAVMGSASYYNVHLGGGGKMDPKHLIVVPAAGTARAQRFGKFRVTFRPSAHVGSHSFVQRRVEGQITEPLRTPTRFSRFKCGDVFVIHIEHPQGSIVVTTTAGARPDQLEGLRADVVFLGIGFLSKECPCKQNLYWQETVGKVNPKAVVPVHWDDFSLKLSKPLKPRPRWLENTKAAMDFVHVKAAEENPPVRVLVMDAFESIRLRNGEVQ